VIFVGEKEVQAKRYKVKDMVSGKVKGIKIWDEKMMDRKEYSANSRICKRCELKESCGNIWKKLI
jgi:MoaA/NifB/PqqE/SkfB family radical SAM enzyme